MPKKAGSRADTNLSLDARSRPNSTRHQGHTLLSPKSAVPWERYTPLSARVYRLFPC